MDLGLEVLAVLVVVDYALEVLVAVLHLVHHALELVGGGADCVGVALAALIKVLHFLSLS